MFNIPLCLTFERVCYVEVSIVQKSRAYGYDDTTPIRHYALFKEQ